MYALASRPLSKSHQESLIFHPSSGRLNFIVKVLDTLRAIIIIPLPSPSNCLHDPTAKRATLMARDVPSADLERRSYAFSPTRSIACAGALDPFDSSFEKTRVYPSGLSRPSEREKYKEKRRGTGAKRAPFNRGFFF
jgi:hypothetical protein